MESAIFSVFFFVLVAFHCEFRSCVARDTITSSTPLSNNGETLVSAGKSFEMGFFRPGDNNNVRSYVGIWYYNLSRRTYVWVANREVPLLSATGYFVIAEDGNLKLLDAQGNSSYFDTNLGSSGAVSSRTLKLLDSGNLILIDDQSGHYLWQSFLGPTDTFLPGMLMHENLKLVSWMDPGNPAMGNYTFQADPEIGSTVLMIMKRSILHWRSDETESTGLPFFVASLLSNSSASPDKTSGGTKPYPNQTSGGINALGYSNSRLLMNYSGQIQFYSLEQHDWSLIWSEPHPCSVFNPCGKFGVCNILQNWGFRCECLEGFGPVSTDNWKSGDFTGGCVRKYPICNKDSKPDTFLNFTSMKVGKHDSNLPQVGRVENCKLECLNNCKTQCQAYSYVIGRDGTDNCFMWTSDLSHLQEDSTGRNHNLSIRIAASAIGFTSRDCESCGNHILPYPLSTRPNCGDPSYHSFSCDGSTNQLSFLSMNYSYQVIHIDTEEFKFVIGTNFQTAGNCTDGTSSGLMLDYSLPFELTNWCYSNELLNLTDAPSIEVGQMIQISWKPPSEPLCNSSLNCTDWPHSYCSAGQRPERCLCDSIYRWDGRNLTCISVEPDLMQSGGRSPKSETSIAMKRVAVIIVSTVIGVVTLAGSLSCFFYRTRILAKERKESIPGKPVSYLYDDERVTDLVAEDDNTVDLPYFSLESILAATDNFSDAHKLGQGGFGPVYKATFPGGRDLAIKRLSSNSDQGMEEFRNEVVLIAKLQHRNLVRLMGYCIRGSEKLLLYEHMPNKSLDTFIFDQGRSILLDWSLRFDIILGITRGLLYLHQDSRLTIVHRDLKTSNILLDEDMNPKISDFGLARIVAGKETEASTMKIIGTYGYMSPEYAQTGFYSVKSDVFSFGVILLEIISGKRNTGFFHSGESLSLLGYAWRLWEERNAMDLVDNKMLASCNITDVIKCINIGLLCVQEDPNDRPTMSNVLIMLGSETTTLPSPNQPGFSIVRLTSSTSASSSYKLGSKSINEITVSSLVGR